MTPQEFLDIWAPRVATGECHPPDELGRDLAEVLAHWRAPQIHEQPLETRHPPTLLICDCGKWHRCPVRATEEAIEQFDCGLVARLLPDEETAGKSGAVEFERHGQCVGVSGLGTATGFLIILVNVE